MCELIFVKHLEQYWALYYKMWQLITNVGVKNRERSTHDDI